MNPEKQNGLPVDYQGVHRAKIFQGGGIPIEEASNLQSLIERKMSRLSGDDITRFNDSFEQVNKAFRDARERGDITADKKYQEAILELCK